MRRLLPLAAALAVIVPPTASGVDAATTKVTGTTGPGFTITLRKAGKKVKTLKRGKYAITVSDKSSSHDFVLTGPGIRNKQITGLGFTGKRTATVTLRKGRYEYYCTPHRSHGMRGFVTVR